MDDQPRRSGLLIRNMPAALPVRMRCQSPVITVGPPLTAWRRLDLGLVDSLTPRQPTRLRHLLSHPLLAGVAVPPAVRPRPPTSVVIVTQIVTRFVAHPGRQGASASSLTSLPNGGHAAGTHRISYSRSYSSLMAGYRSFMKRWPYPIRMFLTLLACLPLGLLINRVFHNSCHESVGPTLLQAGTFALVLLIGLLTGTIRERPK